MSKYTLEKKLEDGSVIELLATAEQEAIIDAGLSTKDNLLLDALAGSAKTSTLQFLCKYLPKEPTISVAFNKRIAEEMAKVLPGHVQPRTLNSVGHNAWAQSTGKKLIVDGKKSYIFTKQYCDELPKAHRDFAYDRISEILNAVKQAKIQGYIPKRLDKEGLISEEAFFYEYDDDFPTKYVDDILINQIRASFNGAIDFDDQIYMPVLFGSSFPRFPVTMVDEAQDLSGINHALLEKLVTGRLIAVGDPWQSIYAFRGSVRASMDRLRDRFDMTRMDLTVSFRCPIAIVERAHRRVPHMKWAPNARPGLVQTLEEWDAQSLANDAAVVCRNNAPLYSLAMSLLKNGRGCTIVGSDVGSGIVRKLKSLSKDMSTPRITLMDKIDMMVAEEVGRGKKNPDTIHDQAEAMKVFVSKGRDLNEAVMYAEDLFKQKGKIQLLSGHKAKGLEWNTVYHLDPWRIPSKYAETDDEKDQELNVDYVITTRSKDKLFLISRDYR